jgi:hypothetical protein
MSFSVPKRKYLTICLNSFGKKNKGMRLINFLEKFPDEASCKVHFRNIRLAEGVICKKCKSKDHYWLQGKEQFECKQCKFRTTLRSGTCMQSSHLSFRQWYICVHLMTSIKKSISAKEMQRQLGRSRYQPVWEMMHKIRLMMGNRDDNYVIANFLKIDNSYFKMKRRKNEKIENIFVAIDPGAERMRVITRKRISDLEPEKERYNNVTPFMERATRLSDIHAQEKKTQSWMRNILSNAKRIFTGIHHSISLTFLQNYFDEFCYKFNRRNIGRQLFNRVIVAGVSTTWRS